MQKVNNQCSERIVMIDALRGFALMGILFLHHIEHFNLFAKPLEAFRPEWLTVVDTRLWNGLFYVFGNKSFALFSLLFGVSYWLLRESAKASGESYIFRHVWRMFILFIIGLVHICFYGGDILTKYAVLGLLLVAVHWLSAPMVLFTAFILLLNPFNLFAFVTWFAGGELVNTRLQGWSVNLTPILKSGAFIEVLMANFQQAVFSSLAWNWNAGRLFTIPGLFFLGVYMAQTKLLTQGSLNLWYRLLVVGILCWWLFDLLYQAWASQLDIKLARVLFKSALKTYMNLGMTLMILALFVIFWRHNQGDIWLKKLVWFGRMGLSNYVFMAVSGAILYYGWALGLYQYLGTSLTFLLAVLLLILQTYVSYLWLQHFQHGPLEAVWRRATWLGQVKPNTRT